MEISSPSEDTRPAWARNLTPLAEVRSEIYRVQSTKVEFANGHALLQAYRRTIILTADIGGYGRCSAITSGRGRYAQAQRQLKVIGYLDETSKGIDGLLADDDTTTAALGTALKAAGRTVATSVQLEWDEERTPRITPAMNHWMLALPSFGV